MNKNEIIILAKALGSRKIQIAKLAVMMNCPLAEWTHKNGSDSSPSFGIFWKEDRESTYNCFACHEHGLVTSLVSRLNRERNGIYTDLLNWVVEVNKVDITKVIEKAFKEEIPEQIIDYRTFSEDELINFKGHVPKYILDRKVTIDSCKLWGVGYDKNNEDPRVIFPVRDVKNNLVGIVGRTIRDKDPRYKNYWGFNKERFLFGEHLYNPDFPVVVVEGMISVIKAKQVLKDINALAIMGSAPSSYQISKLMGFCLSRPLITIYDGDEAGDSARELTSQALDKKLAVFHVNLPRNTDPDSVLEDILIERFKNVGF